MGSYVILIGARKTVSYVGLKNINSSRFDRGLFCFDLRWNKQIDLHISIAIGGKTCLTELLEQ